MMSSAYLSKGAPARLRSKRLYTSVVAFIVASFFVVLSVLGSLQAPQKAQAVEDGWTPQKWLYCSVFKGTVMDDLYRWSVGYDDEFFWFSKSVVTTGTGDVRGGLNWFLDLDGKRFITVNEDVLGRSLSELGSTNPSPTLPPTALPSATPSAPSTPTPGQTPNPEGNGDDGNFNDPSSPYNQGVKVNPYDRFGVAGMVFTNYSGEWKYVDVSPCSMDVPKDPKVNQFYENRLVPQSGWDDQGNTKDLRTKQHSRLILNDLAAAFLNTFSNWLFWITKLIVVLAIALIEFAFSDIVTLIGAQEFVAGKSANDGIVPLLFKNLFMPLIVPVFVITALKIGWEGLVKRQFRKGLGLLARSVAMFFLAIVAMTNAVALVALPNNVAILVQAAIIKSMDVSFAGGNGLCSSNVGALKDPGASDETLKKDATANATAKKNVDQDFIQRSVKDIRSSIGCSFWQQFLLRPWSQGQFGVNWDQTWVKGKRADWDKNGVEFQNYDDNAKMVGTADVPLGGGVVLHNWAIFQLSTQTNVHSPMDAPGKPAKYTTGVANDWWRIVDAQANYEEVKKQIDLGGVPGAAPGETTPTTGENGGGGVAALTDALKKLQAAGYKVTENSAMGDPPEPGVHSKTSYHYKGNGDQAADINTAPGASPAEMAKLKLAANWLAAAGFHTILEAPDHYNHLHVDLAPKAATGYKPNKSGPFPPGMTAPSATGAAPATPTTPTTPDTGAGDPPSTGVQEYSEPKNNPALDTWSVWTGNSPFGRLFVAATSVLVALVGVIAPLLFAALSAVYSIGLVLIMAFAPVMFLFACWAGKGWEIFKGWGELVINTTLKRIAMGVLLMLSIMFSSTAIKIMETDSWWEGVVIMMLLGYILITSRHKIMDAVAAVRFGGANISAPANRIGAKSMGFMKGTAQTGIASLGGGVAAARAGGSFQKGMAVAAKAELRSRAGRNQLLREVSRASDFRSIQNNEIPSDLQFCAACGNTLRSKSEEAFMIVAVSPTSGAIYCPECYENGDAPEDCIIQDIDFTRVYEQKVEESRERQGGAARAAVKEEGEDLFNLHRDANSAASYGDPETLRRAEAARASRRQQGPAVQEATTALRTKNLSEKEYYDQLARCVVALDQDMAAISEFRGKVAFDIPPELQGIIRPDMLAQAHAEGNLDAVREQYIRGWMIWGIQHAKTPPNLQGDPRAIYEEQRLQLDGAVMREKEGAADEEMRTIVDEARGSTSNVSSYTINAEGRVRYTLPEDSTPPAGGVPRTPEGTPVAPLPAEEDPRTPYTRITREDKAPTSDPQEYANTVAKVYQGFEKDIQEWERKANEPKVSEGPRDRDLEAFLEEYVKNSSEVRGYLEAGEVDRARDAIFDALNEEALKHHPHQGTGVYGDLELKKRSYMEVSLAVETMAQQVRVEEEEDVSYVVEDDEERPQ